VDGERGDPDVVIRLSYAEAVVLDALLHRWEREGVLDSMTFEDQAEQRVLWDLTATFEPLIDEVFDQDYARTVARSRAAVRDDERPASGPT
jgi:hypothetical protein